MKIAYCLNSISRVGGIEQAVVTKANALAAIAGNEVFVLVTDHEAGVGAAAQLAGAVHLIDLQIDYYDDDWKSKWNVLKGFFVKRRAHKRRLAETLHALAPDVVVAVGQAEKYMLPEIKGDWAVVRELHYRKDFRRVAAASRGWFYRIAARLSDGYDYGCKIGGYDCIVSLTHEDRAMNWQNADKVTVIPNPVTFREEGVAPLTGRKILAVGRLTAQKNYASLIRSFRTVADRHPDWTLEICGDGDERARLEALIRTLGLEEQVRLCGTVAQVQAKMLEASCFVLSSLFEGLPLVMLEAMSCGLPVVSYACPCGPKDIITEGEDGFLVPPGDERSLAGKICRLIEDPVLRARMGAAAFAKSENYRPERIVPMWMALFERLLSEKRGRC